MYLCTALFSQCVSDSVKLSSERKVALRSVNETNTMHRTSEKHTHTLSPGRKHAFLCLILSSAHRGIVVVRLSAACGLALNSVDVFEDYQS